MQSSKTFQPNVVKFHWRTICKPRAQCLLGGIDFVQNEDAYGCSGTKCNLKLSPEEKQRTRMFLLETSEVFFFFLLFCESGIPLLRWCLIDECDCAVTHLKSTSQISAASELHFNHILRRTHLHCSILTSKASCYLDCTHAHPTIILSSPSSPHSPLPHACTQRECRREKKDRPMIKLHYHNQTGEVKMTTYNVTE